jgi:hypothetical protein
VSLAAGLDPVGSIVAGADLFVPKRNAGGRIDDGAGALRKMLSCVALYRCESVAVTPLWYGDTNEGCAGAAS